MEEEEEVEEFGKDWGFVFLDCGECGANFMVGNCGEGERISGAFVDRDKGLCYDCIDKIGCRKLPLVWKPTARPDHFLRKRKQGR